MSIVIDDPDLERKLRRLAAVRGESVEDLVRQGISTLSKEPLPAARSEQSRTAATGFDNGQSADVPDWVRELQARFRKSAVDLESTDDELLGYDEDGLPS